MRTYKKNVVALEGDDEITVEGAAQGTNVLIKHHPDGRLVLILTNGMINAVVALECHREQDAIIITPPEGAGIEVNGEDNGMRFTGDEFIAII